jgi:hypothetical protein
MTKERRFKESALSATELLERLVVLGRRSGRASGMPSLLHLQTICRRHGCSLPELDLFAQIRDRAPACLVLGGAE